MTPDGWTEGQTDRRTDGHGQTYIPLPSAGDKNTIWTNFLFFFTFELMLSQTTAISK